MNAKKSKLFAWTTLTIAQIGYVPLTSTSLMTNSNRFRAVTPLTQHCFEMLLKMYNEEKNETPSISPNPNQTPSKLPGHWTALIRHRNRTLRAFSLFDCWAFHFYSVVASFSVRLTSSGWEGKIRFHLNGHSRLLDFSAPGDVDMMEDIFFLFLLEGNFVNTGFIAI